jgi:hypothetical protein
MKDNQKHFLILRAEGLSFDKIAVKLKVSKVTLIKWSRLFKDEIKDLQFLELQALKEKYKYDKQNQYEILLKQLNKFNDAIIDIDLSNASVRDLHLIRNDILARLDEIEKRTVFTNTELVSTCEITGNEEKVTVQLLEV